MEPEYHLHIRATARESAANLALRPDHGGGTYGLRQNNGSELVLVDVTWDDGQSLDIVGQTDVDYSYFYIPLSSEYEHEADEHMARFIQYINGAARG